MKRIITCIASLLLGTTAFAQQSDYFLEGNLIKVLLHPDGNLFNTFGFGGGFEVPKGTYKSTIYTSGIWIGGISNNQLHLAAETYKQMGTDFQFGPVAQSYTTTNYTNTYNKVWLVSADEITTHQTQWNKSGYTMPAGIAQWPGNGNTQNGEAAKLAPFYDQNSNGLYEPAQGDYPLIRGDRAAFYIVNDDKLHTESNANSLKIEMHVMLYTFNAPTDTPVNQSVFMNFSIYNRSGNAYSDVYFGNFVDFDLGNYNDDFIGCNPKKNMFFAYNGDNYDEPSALGYGSELPAQGVIFLNYPLSRFVYYNNTQIATGNPSTPQQYYNYLKGQWKDGTSITSGGNGYGGTTPVNFMFPGNNDPDQSTPWDEKIAGNSPGDRRGLGSIGPFNLWAGTKLCVDMALPFARTSISGDPDNALIQLERHATRLQEFYAQQGYSCSFLTGTGKAAKASAAISLYPNPTASNLNVEVHATASHTFTLQLYNQLGQVVKNVTLTTGSNHIAVNDITQGIYYYQVIADNATIISGKLMKQ